MPKTATTPSTSRKGLKEGWRSGLEERVGEELRSILGHVKYEPFKIDYEVPARAAKYTPDFVLPNGVIIETKGRFVTADRQKHLLIKQQRPELDIRFIFQNPNAPLYKGSPTTYAQWCEKHGFIYAKAATPAQRRKGTRSIPKEWFR